LKLYFLRHAHAEDSAVSDHERRLTEKGIRAASSVSQLLATLGLQPSKVYSSPRVRAKQTAEIVAAALGREVEIREEVNFGFGLPAVTTLIEGLKEDDEVMFVGHEPTMSLTIGEITGGRVQMKKAGFARVDTVSASPIRGELVWLLAPKVIAAIED
jgi:phosphohistidine phosphatase